jgi:hypothetical protein
LDLAKLAPVTEVIHDSANAEPEISVTESGRSSACRLRQHLNSSKGIFVRCDGASNVTDDNFEQSKKQESPRVETEEGIVNEAKR